MNNLRPRKLYGISIVILLLCIGLYTVPFSIMGNTLTYIPGDTGDAALNNYFLEHGFQWLSGKQKSFWNAPFFYPEPQVMTFSDNFFGTMPVYSVFRFSGFDRETSFQLWIIAMFILNYISCVWVLRKFSISMTGAAAGAFIFTFSLPVIAQLGHIQLLPRFMVPFAFYLTWRYLKKPDLKLLAGLCLSIVLQFYCTIYIGYFLVLSLALFVISCAIINAKDYRWREVLWISKSIFAYRAAIIIASGIILLPLFFPYYKTSLEYGLRDWGEIYSMLPRLRSLILPPNGSLVWGWLNPFGNTLPMAWEHQIFIGALPWLAAAIAIFSIIKKDNNETKEISKAAAVSIILILLYVMYWNGASFYKFTALIPGARAIRSITRIILVLSFLFAISTGVLFTVLEHLLNKKKASYLSPVFLLVLLGILVADQYVLPLSVPRYLKSDLQAHSREVADKVMKEGPAAKVFAYMPSKSTDPPYAVHMYAMLASQSLHIPTINGYSGSIPRDYDFYLNYDKLWSLKKWITLTKAKYGRLYNSAGSIFNGLVIVGSQQENDDSRFISMARDELPNEGFKVKIIPAYEKITAKTGTSIMLPVEVTNKSNIIWSALGDFDGRNKISLSCRWLSSNGEEIEGYTSRYPLQYDLLPGESITLDTEIKARTKSGIYILEFDMVQENVSWFSNKGSETARVEIAVE